MRGETFPIAARLLQESRASLEVDSEEWKRVRNMQRAVSLGWPAFTEAAWIFLWVRRGKDLFSVTLFGITLFRKRWADLRGVWEDAFGPCPFPWEEGPGELPAFLGRGSDG